MGHVTAHVEVIGTEDRVTVGGVLVDRGASFTVLPVDVIEKIGGLKLPIKPVNLELGDGKIVGAELYAIGIVLKGREGGTLAAFLGGAKPVIGVRTLEDLGLKPNLITGEVEEERPPGVAYFYQNNSLKLDTPLKA